MHLEIQKWLRAYRWQCLYWIFECSKRKSNKKENSHLSWWGKKYIGRLYDSLTRQRGMKKERKKNLFTIRSYYHRRENFMMHMLPIVCIIYTWEIVYRVQSWKSTWRVRSRRPPWNRKSFPRRIKKKILPLCDRIRRWISQKRKFHETYVVCHVNKYRDIVITRMSRDSL